MTEELSGRFSADDRDQLSRHGIDLEDAEWQLEILRSSEPRFRQLDRPAVVGDGIHALSARRIVDLLGDAERARLDGRVSKFVPASGAATRMFQTLISALDEHDLGDVSDEARREVDRFIEAIPLLAIRHELVQRGLSPAEPGGDSWTLLRAILGPEGAGLASRPKGLVPFHDDTTRGRTAFEEHLREALLYTADKDGVARVHFTVPDRRRGEFETLLARERGALEDEYGCSLQVTLSSQRNSTDTICVGLDGAPLRDDEGGLVFRPGGHGSLLSNLEDLGGDIVVIKNIDNVVPKRAIREVVHWQNVLIGFLAVIQESIHVYLREIHADGTEPNWLGQALAFTEQHLSIPVPPEVHSEGIDAKRKYLLRVLDRPIRVCGVVKNQGEPGGGPFWVRHSGRGATLQIVESAEVDHDDEEQERVWGSSTHFNPVDLVVGLRDWKGESFSLEKFTDPEAVFRARKSADARSLVALERPGLWNGSMADWTTIFVEVPLTTFAPVKAVFDLLRPEHR